MKKYLALIAVEMQVPDVSLVRNEDGRRQIEITVLLWKPKDFVFGAARDGADRGQLKASQNSGGRVVLRATQSRGSIRSREINVLLNGMKIGCDSALSSALVYSSCTWIFMVPQARAACSIVLMFEMSWCSNKFVMMTG